MFLASSQFLYFMEIMIFVSVVFMHMCKKNTSVVFLYMFQSSMLTMLLLVISIKEASLPLALVTGFTFIVKVVIAPIFFLNLIKRHKLKFEVSTYLNMPMTLLVLTVLLTITYYKFLKPLVSLAPSKENLLLLSFATILASIFLIINRRGALSQMIGILSLENGIVSFASLAGLEENPGLQIGIIFNLLVWVVIATVFVSMIYKKFGTLDVTTMKHLKE